MDENVTTNLVFIVMGIFVFWGMVFIVRQDNKTRKAATVKTKATVTNHRNLGKYRPIYEYFVGNTRVSVFSKHASSPPLFKEGDVVDIYYDPQNPKEIYVPKERRFIYIIIIACVVMSAAAFYAGFSSLLS